MKVKKPFVILGLSVISLMVPLVCQSKVREQVKADTTKDLANIISFKDTGFLNNYIGDYFVNFKLSERIFTSLLYLNDNLNSFKDANNNPINLADGIIINGQTFRYWVNFTSDDLVYSRNEGVHVHPLSNGGVYSPVAIEIKSDSIDCKFNLDYFPMDSIEVTFKAGVFAGYYNGVNYVLNEDLTFSATLDEKEGVGPWQKVTFVKQKEEKIIKPVITSVNDSGELTASGGGKYHRYLVWTNVPRDASHVSATFASDNDRYIFDNIEFNGKQITRYNTWARGNSKDFTNLSDASSQNPAYETRHPTGSKNVNYDFAIYTQMAIDQPNYVYDIKIPNQLMTDWGYTDVNFSFREGSAWYTKDKDGNPFVGRVDSAAVDALALEKIIELDSLVDITLYRLNDQEDISNIISDASSAILNAFTCDEINAIFEEASAQILAKKTDEELTSEETIGAVTQLIDAIPDEITYTEECFNLIKAALEAYISLTPEQQNQLSNELVNKMYAAYAQYQALDLANYKSVTKATLNALVNLDIYFQEEKESVTNLKNNAENAINNANSREEVDEAYDAFVNALALVKDAKTLAIEELDALDLSDCTTEQLAKINKIIEEGKLSIAQSQNAKQVETLLNRIKAAIEAIKQNKEESEQPGESEDPSTPTEPNKNKGIPVGALIGAIIGGVVLAAALGVIGFILGKKAKK